MALSLRPAATGAREWTQAEKWPGQQGFASPQTRCEPTVGVVQRARDNPWHGMWGLTALDGVGHGHGSKSRVVGLRSGMSPVRTVLVAARPPEFEA